MKINTFKSKDWEHSDDDDTDISILGKVNINYKSVS